MWYNIFIVEYNNNNKGVDFMQLEQVKLAKEDMLNFVDKEDIEFEENGSNTDYLEFSIYEKGDYTKNHCDIKVNKLEVL